MAETPMARFLKSDYDDGKFFNYTLIKQYLTLVDLPLKKKSHMVPKYM